MKGIRSIMINLTVSQDVLMRTSEVVGITNHSCKVLQSFLHKVLGASRRSFSPIPFRRSYCSFRVRNIKQSKDHLFEVFYYFDLFWYSELRATVFQPYECCHFTDAKIYFERQHIQRFP